MSKLLVLILYSTLTLLSCQTGKSVKTGKAANPTATPLVQTEKVPPNTSETAVNWSSSPRFGCVSAPDNDTFWAVIDDADGKLILTEDGGANWKTVREKGVSCIDFIDENHGWLKDSSHAAIFSTEDGGKTWFKKQIDDTVSSAQEIKFTDTSNGWFKNSTELFHTSDGGERWNQVLSYDDKYLRGQPDGWFFSDSRTGWICDGGDVSGNLYHTADAGATWSIKKVGESGSAPCRIFFVDLTTGFYSLQKQFFQTKDGGETWDKIASLPANFEIRSMAWFDQNNGWLAGFFDNKTRQPQSGKGAILRTTDGGKKWTETSVGQDVPFFTRILFTDAQNGWLISRDNVYKTSDGGAKWNLSYSLPLLK